MHGNPSTHASPRPPGAVARAGAGCQPLERRDQLGFTLVELITVVLILGVLAAVALPRFTNLQGKAREAKVKAIAGSMAAAATLAKSAAMANRVSCDSATGTAVMMEGLSIELNHCYPQALGSFSQGILGAAQVLATDDWLIAAGTGGAAAGSVLTLQLSNASTPASCAVTYTASNSAVTGPTVAVTASGC